MSPNAMIPMTQVVLADVAGVPCHSIYALLQELSKFGFAGLGYCAVEVSDISGLREFIDWHQLIVRSVQKDWQSSYICTAFAATL